MTPAIRIIKSTPTPHTANLLILEREKLIMDVAIKVAEASGHITPERVDSCAEKLRAISERFRHRTPDQLALDISNRMSSPAAANALMAHADLDYDRIMELLEG